MDDFKYSSPLRCMKSSTPSTTTASNSKSGFSNPNFVNMKNQSRASPVPDFIPIGSSNSPQNNFPRRFPNSNSSFRTSDRGFSSPNFTSSPNRSPYGRPGFNRGRNSDFGGGNRGNFQQRNSFRPRMDHSRNDVDISQYFHSSMLDDPWAELRRASANSREANDETTSSPDNDRQI